MWPNKYYCHRYRRTFKKDEPDNHDMFETPANCAQLATDHYWWEIIGINIYILLLVGQTLIYQYQLLVGQSLIHQYSSLS